MEHIVHSFVDTLVLLPLLFFIYLLVEYSEHKNNNYLHGIFKKSKRLGPLLGALLGTVPQCGFSVVAAALFSERVISLGTLVAIFLATSDEAIPLMLAHPEKIPELIALLVIKFLIAVCVGFLIDIFAGVDKEEHACCDGHHHFHGNCESCEGGILKSAVVHSAKIFVYIFIANVIIGYLTENAAPVLEYISGSKPLQAILAPLFGIIPNCAASVALTELYLAGKIALGSLIGGLCTGAGVGLLVLFKQNKDMKQNIRILILLYAVGVLCGALLQYIL